MFGLFGSLQQNLINKITPANEINSECNESPQKPLEDSNLNASLLAGL